MMQNAGAGGMGAEQAAPDDSQGYTICIDVLPDGTFTVSKESLAQEAQEGNEPAGESFGSADEALAAAAQMIDGGAVGDEQQQMEQAFRGAAKGGM